MNEKYQWTKFYEEFADKLFEYINRKEELFDKLKEFNDNYSYFQYLNLDNKEWWGPRNNTIDSFSVMAVMNRGLTDENRINIGKLYADFFNISSPVPSDFSGIPVLNNMRSFLGDTGDNPLWSLFEEALEYAQTNKVTERMVDSFNDTSHCFDSIGMLDRHIFTRALYVWNFNVIVLSLK